MNTKPVLETQANRIEAVLSLHKVPVRVTGGTVTPHWIMFQVLPAVGAKMSRIKSLSEELAASLDASTCRVSRRGAAIAIEVPRDDPQPVRLLPLLRQCQQNTTYPPVTATLGLAEDGSPLLIRLPSPDVGHVLISGNNGAGKTTLLNSIVISLALTNSPDKIAFVFLGNSAPLAKKVREMGFLAKGFAAPKWSAIIPMATQAAGRRVIIVADDVFVADGAAEKALLVSTAARVMGYKNWHFILAWDGIPPAAIRDLFGVRIVGRVTSVEDARTATGRSGTGAERLLGQGDFLAVAEGRVTRFQSAQISPGQEDDDITIEQPATLAQLIAPSRPEAARLRWGRRMEMLGG